MNDRDNEISKVSNLYTQKQVKSDFTILRIQTEPLFLFSLQIYKALECFLEVIESCIINGLKLTLLNRNFLALFRTGEGGHILLSQ